MRTPKGKDRSKRAGPRGRGAGPEAPQPGHRALLRAVIEQVSEGITLLAPRGTVLEINPAGLALLEADRRGQAIGRPIDPYVSPAYRERFREVLARTSRGAPAALEFELVGRKGGRRWVQARAVPLRPPRRRIAAVLAFIREITTENRTRESPQEDGERFQALVTASPLAVFLLDRSEAVQLWNPAAERIFGWSSDEVVGRQLPIVPEEELEESSALRERVLRGETIAGVEVRRQRRDGALIDVRLWAGPLRGPGGSVTGIMAVAAEIAERRRAEDWTRIQAAALAAAANGIIISDRSGTIQWVNPAFTRLTGYSLDEVRGQNPRLLKSGRHDRAFYEQLWSTILSGEVWRGEMLNRRKDGSVYVEEQTITPVRDEVGRVTHFVAIKQDVTERRRAEENQARLTAIIEATTDFVGIADRDGRGVYLNRAGRKMIGIAEDEDISGFSIAAAHPDRYRNLVMAEAIPAAVREGVWQGETALLSSDGREIPVSQVIIAHKASDGTVQFLSTIARDISALKQAEQRIRLQLDRLDALRSIDIAITASLDLRVTLTVILDQAVAQLRADAARILLLEPQMQTLEFAAGRGFRTAALQHARVRLGEGHAGLAALERRVISIHDLRVELGTSPWARLVVDEGFLSYHAAPLVAKGQVKGALELFGRAPLDPDPEWLNFLEALATQAAIAIDNAELFDGLQRGNTQLVRAYDTTLEGWSRALELRDRETEGHTQRVTELTLRLARALGMREEELVHVRRGALLHDIGKLGIPDSILLKPGPLTADESEIMKRHPVYAHDLLASIAYLRPALDIPYCHHERWDGTGYPRGLKGEEIPPAARIFAVADAWDALRSGRPYRPAWTREEALGYIRERSGTSFDPKSR